MPRPQEYQIAQSTFDALLDRVAEDLLLPSRHAAYTALEAYFHVKRVGLSPSELVTYANTLPVVARALAIQGWHDGETAKLPKTDAERDAAMMALRKQHNFLKPGCFRAVDGILSKPGEGH
ncbi:MAG: DUF2267 domain-containing protein [Pseudomonadota bacterium]